MAKRRQPRKKGTGSQKGKKSANLRYSVPTRTPKGGIYPHSGSKNYEAVCALSNPFCAAARGSRIPDDDSSPSIPATMTNTFEVVTDSAGDAAFSISPALFSIFKTASVVTGTTATTWNSAQAIKDYTALSTAAHEIRVVSFGVRVYSVLAPTEQSGYCRLMTAPEVFVNGINLDGGLWEAVETYPMSELDAHVILKPQGNEWKSYKPMTDFFNYNYLAGIVKGAAPSKTALIVELVVNVEFTVNLSNITASVALPGEPSNPHVLAAASRVHAKHKGIHNGTTQTVGSKLLGFAKTALLDVAASAIPYFGGAVKSLFTGGNRYPTIMEVD